MLIYSMSVSVDGLIADRDGAFEWTAPSEELFRFHTALVRELGGYLLGRRLYEAMLVWETDAWRRRDHARAASADNRNELSVPKKLGAVSTPCVMPLRSKSSNSSGSSASRCGACR